MKQIKALLSDIDGVLTDGKIIHLEGEWKRVYNIQDGMGIKYWRKSGKLFGVISGSNTKEIKTRFEELGVDFLSLGNPEDKVSALFEFCNQYALDPKEIAYIGDDHPDLSILEKVGFPAVVPNAVKKLLQKNYYTTKKSGGSGAVRELIDHLMGEENG